MAKETINSPTKSDWEHEWEELFGRTGVTPDRCPDLQLTRKIVAHNLKWVRSHFSLSESKLASAADIPQSVLKQVEKASRRVDPKLFPHIAMHLELYCRISRFELMTLPLNDDRYAFPPTWITKRWR